MFLWSIKENISKLISNSVSRLNKSLIITKKIYCKSLSLFVMNSGSSVWLTISRRHPMWKWSTFGWFSVSQFRSPKFSSRFTLTYCTRRRKSQQVHFWGGRSSNDFLVENFHIFKHCLKALWQGRPAPTPLGKKFSLSTK